MLRRICTRRTYTDFTAETEKRALKFHHFEHQRRRVMESAWTSNKARWHVRRNPACGQKYLIKRQITVS